MYAPTTLAASVSRLGELPADPVISLVPDINFVVALCRPDELSQLGRQQMNATNLRRMLGNAADIMGNIVKKENRG